MTSLAAGGDDRGQTNRLRRWLGSTSKSSLALTAAISCGIFWLLGNLAGVPAERHYQAGLLSQPSPVIAVCMVFAGLFGISLLLSAIEATDEPEVPLFGAVAGLATLSWRGGTMTIVLQNSPLIVFPTMAVELILLGAIIFGCWHLLRRRMQIQDDEDAEWNTRLLCTGTAALAMLVVMYFLCQTDAKKQVMAAVGISAFAGAATAYSIFSVRWAGCYLAPPLLVVAFGYLLTYYSPGDWHIGRTGQPLAYPLPLDYASLGTVGSLLGYWAAQKWKHEANDE
jgi:hypothetical protein